MKTLYVRTEKLHNTFLKFRNLLRRLFSKNVFLFFRQYYNENVKSIEQPRDIAANKTKAVAWFVSNCGARNGRLNYAKELSKYIEVDIYGACGTKRCPRVQSNTCFDMLNRDYKFYLAFENSNCKDYITEKFFVNGLS